MAKICCFIGHRKTVNNDELRKKILNLVENLIKNENFDTFLFGSRSDFDDLCHEVVNGLKIKYPFIKRVYVRSEYRFIDIAYQNYLLQNYEETYFPDGLEFAGKSVYVQRNKHMIDKSDLCIFYYIRDYTPVSKKSNTSGTKIAFEYAEKNKKRIILII